jgi:hypothetical protein
MNFLNNKRSASAIIDSIWNKKEEKRVCVFVTEWSLDESMLDCVNAQI